MTEARQGWLSIVPAGIDGSVRATSTILKENSPPGQDTPVQLFKLLIAFILFVPFQAQKRRPLQLKDHPLYVPIIKISLRAFFCLHAFTLNVS